MTDVRIEIRVSTDGRLVAIRRPRARVLETKVSMDGIDADVIRVFQDWLRDPQRTLREVEIRTFGAVLHRFLFGEHGWGRIDSEIRNAAPDRVRLELVFPASGEYARLAAIPWEYLYRPDLWVPNTLPLLTGVSAMLLGCLDGLSIEG